MLALDEQKVRCCLCMFEFEYVTIWYMMHYESITIAHSPAILMHDNDNGNDKRLCADVDND